MNRAIRAGVRFKFNGWDLSLFLLFYGWTPTIFSFSLPPLFKIYNFDFYFALALAFLFFFFVSFFFHHFQCLGLLNGGEGSWPDELIC